MPDVPRGSAATHLLRSPGVVARWNTLASQPAESLAACRLTADGANRQRRSFTFAVTFGTLLLSSTVAERAVTSSRVVPALDVAEERKPRFGLGLEDASLDQLGLDACEEALGHRVGASSQLRRMVTLSADLSG